MENGLKIGCSVIMVLWMVMAVIASCPILLGIVCGILLYLGGHLLWALLAWWIFGK